MNIKRIVTVISMFSLALTSLSGCGNKTDSNVNQPETTEETTVATTSRPVIIANNREMETVKETEGTSFQETENKEENAEQTTVKTIHKQSSVEVDDSEKSIHFGIEQNTDFDLSVINICGADVDLSSLDYDTFIENTQLKRGKEIEIYDIINDDKEFNFTAYAYSRNFFKDNDETAERVQTTDIDGNQLLFNGVGNVFNLVTENNGVINPDNPKTINTFILNKIWNTFPESIDTKDDVPVKLFGGKINWQKPVALKKVRKILGEGTNHNGFICYNDGTTTMLIEKISESSDFIQRIYFYENSTVNAK